MKPKNVSLFVITICIVNSFAINITAVGLCSADCLSNNCDKSTSNDNTPPNPPFIFGPNKGKIETMYDFDIGSTDVDRDDLSYFIEWGDGTCEGWTRLLPSGETLTVSHEWEKVNFFKIRVKAKDEHDAESEWSTLEVYMPTLTDNSWQKYRLENTQIINQFLSKFYLIFSNLFPFYTFNMSL